MRRMRVLALCAVLGAALGATSHAHAQAGLTERLRIQGIYSNQTGKTPPDDFAGQVVPELSLLVLGKRSQLRVTYTFAATAHTTLPTDIANRVNLTSTFELSKRTTLLLSADAGHSTVANALILGGSSTVPVGAVPLTTGQLLTTRVSEGTSWEAGPVVRFNQSVGASYITTIDAPQSLDSYLVNAIVSVDRTWKSDAVGIDFRGGYSVSRAEPLPQEHLIPLAVTPHWRHDISQTLSSSVAAGAFIVLSPDPGTRALVGPFGQASLTYLLDDATLSMIGSVGAQPNALTAQLLFAEQVTLRATAPLSIERGVVASSSVGYVHSTIIDAAANVARDPNADTFIADAGLGWLPTPAVELFARYQFLQQVSAESAVAATPQFQRNAVILGIQLSSRPDPIHVPTRFPQRVDRSDAAPPP